MNITRGIPPPKGLFVTLAAVEGFGKSTLGKHMKNPAFIDADKGVVDPDVMVIESDFNYASVLGIVEEFKRNPPEGVSTIVIDTVDKLIDPMAKSYCKDKGFKSLEDNRYVGWMSFRNDVWLPFLEGLKYVTRKHPISVLAMSHTEMKKYEAPDGGVWDRFEMSCLYKKLAGDLRQASDIYSFGTFKDAVFSADKKAGETKAHATQAKGKRIVNSEHTGVFDAKVRDFVMKADRTPFPTSCSLDDYEKYIKEAIELLPSLAASRTVVQSATEKKTEVVNKPVDTVAKSVDKPEEKQSEKKEHVQEQTVPTTDNPDFDRLNALMKQFGIPRELVDEYVKTTKTFGPNPPPLEKCNAMALKWLCTGISTQKVTTEFIKQKLANAK